MLTTVMQPFRRSQQYLARVDPTRCGLRFAVRLELPAHFTTPHAVCGKKAAVATPTRSAMARMERPCARAAAILGRIIACRARARAALASATRRRASSVRFAGVPSFFPLAFATARAALVRAIIFWASSLATAAFTCKMNGSSSGASAHANGTSFCSISLATNDTRRPSLEIVEMTRIPPRRFAVARALASSLLHLERTR